MYTVFKRFLASSYQNKVKRFYKDVNIVQLKQNSWDIQLDKKSIKSPCGNKLTVANKFLASVIAHEWQSQKEYIYPYTMNMTCLLYTAIDNPLCKSKEEYIEKCVEFIKTDTILFFSEFPKGLADIQERKWLPIINWFNRKFECHIQPVTSLSPNINIEDESKCREYLNTINLNQLIGMQYLIENTKSLLLSISFIEDCDLLADPLCLYESAMLEQIYQIKNWGEVEWAHTIHKHNLLSIYSSCRLFIQNN